MSKNTTETKPANEEKNKNSQQEKITAKNTKNTQKSKEHIEIEKLKTSINEKDNELQEKIKEIESNSEKYQDLDDQYKRLLAEFSNYKKAKIREREDYLKYGLTNILSDIILVMDDFERAIDSAKEYKDFDNFRNGIEMIEKQMGNMLEKNHGLKKIQKTGEKLDFNLHEAIMIENTSVEKEEDIVSEIFRTGYMLYDRVIRPAQVKVKKYKEPDTDKNKEKKSEENNN